MVDTPKVGVAGQAPADTVITINDTIVVVEASDRFSISVPLREQNLLPGRELPILLGVVPFGLIYGVLAINAGLPPATALARRARCWC